MAKGTAVLGFVSLVVLVCGAALSVSGTAQAFTTKRNFECKIELPDADPVFTDNSVKVCADSYISISCQAPVDHDDASETGIACDIMGQACGLASEELLETTQTKLTIKGGVAQLSCVFPLQ